MTKYLALAFTVLSFACGGSQPASTAPASAPTSSPAAEGNETAATAEPTDSTPAPKVNDAGEFKVNEANESSRPGQAKLQPTATEAAVRFFVVDKNKGPVKGVVISLLAPTGEKYVTGETDEDGFVEVLLPIGKTYNLTFLSLGRRNIVAKVAVANEPRLNLKLTLRYQREEYPLGLVLDKVNFATGKATLTQDSHHRLDVVVEYMKYKKSANIEVSGHTDNVGNKRANKKLSQDRAEAVRAYLVSKGIDGARIKAIGYGDEKPIAPNDTPEGREKNRRIEATEL